VPEFLSFWGWIILDGMDTPHLVYLLVHWWHLSCFCLSTDCQQIPEFLLLTLWVCTQERTCWRGWNAARFFEYLTLFYTYRAELSWHSHQQHKGFHFLVFDIAFLKEANGTPLGFWFAFLYWLVMSFLAICMSSLEKCLFRFFNF
jgi:hypothetical protein